MSLAPLPPSKSDYPSLLQLKVTPVLPPIPDPSPKSPKSPRRGDRRVETSEVGVPAFQKFSCITMFRHRFWLVQYMRTARLHDIFCISIFYAIYLKMGRRAPFTNSSFWLFLSLPLGEVRCSSLPSGNRLASSQSNRVRCPIEVKFLVGQKSSLRVPGTRQEAGSTLGPSHVGVRTRMEKFSF